MFFVLHQSYLRHCLLGERGGQQIRSGLACQSSGGWGGKRWREREWVVTEESKRRNRKGWRTRIRRWRRQRGRDRYGEQRKIRTDEEKNAMRNGKGMNRASPEWLTRKQATQNSPSIYRAETDGADQIEGGRRKCACWQRWWGKEGGAGVTTKKVQAWRACSSVP